MLAIRLQRLGRKGYPVYRVAIQEAQRSPQSGRVVAYVGSYNPHSKEVKFNTEKVQFYLKNGAQPTPRVIRLLAEEKIELPDWVKVASEKKSNVKHVEKLRRNRPADEKPAEETHLEAETSTKEPAETTADSPEKA